MSETLEKASLVFSYIWHKVLATIVATFFVFWILANNFFPEPSAMALVLFAIYLIANIVIEPLAMVVYETKVMAKIFKQTRLEGKKNA